MYKIARISSDKLGGRIINILLYDVRNNVTSAFDICGIITSVWKVHDLTHLSTDTAEGKSITLCTNIDEHTLDDTDVEEQISTVLQDWNNFTNLEEIEVQHGKVQMWTSTDPTGNPPT
ncbi:hypothetical protein BLNAU_11397 [Blattamonas nauphoetae]|uniref:Uncharacterized protein n=1 Tax=Blattamonas nauphoetae TaxID=2049346 RepID=A0ABQ9XAU0_9EUKA|nr:hypothetical protein BLNAU_18485 [Blattamonas nauphoetae]KAK2948345.1 hypothetical protein BLNAU_16691 [Blattamonas nauphoetae]KAK2948378.1 hypothetical protein BLNAU_16724 [Blattamonas nauphoetae]KAK2950118.1 hypothetical protein BLNAU_14920 [Blattamonas nauphoetae]KAK2951363.1 hypothetical protein BLNAU_13742 [Blattamonas nauphoetae]